MGDAGHRSLAGRTAVVTGGHRGVGAAISVALGLAGADVIVIDRAGPLSSDVPAKLLAANVRHWSITADLAQADAAQKAGEDALKLAEPDILVNNAGIAKLSSVTDVCVESWDATMAVNVRAPMILSKCFAKGMTRRNRGAIINISSVASTNAIADHAAYCASKGALDMLTRVMALELGGAGVRVNSVAPTVVLTEMGKRAWGSAEKGAPMLARIPQGRFAEPHEVAAVVAFLASDAAAMVNGQVLRVDGGYTAA